MNQATLVITDEVNVKILGLDADTRRLLNNRFKFDIPGARHIPAVRLGRWDGKVSFFQIGGSTYINLLPEILPILSEQGYDIEIDDRRPYAHVFDFAPVDANSLGDSTWPNGHPQQGKPIELRDYQVAAINQFLSNHQSIQCIATGAGKSILTAALSRRVDPYGRSILIVPSKSLVTQTEEDYINVGLDVGVVFGDRKDLNRRHTICTWQSLNALQKNNPELLAQVIDGVVCVIVDECHTLKADRLKGLMTQVLAHVPLRWAVSGTIPKEEHDWRCLQISIGPVINQISAAELQDRGVLADCQVNIVQMVDSREFRSYQEELKYLLETESRLRHIARMVSALEGNTLVLIDRVDPGRQLTEYIAGATFISGSTKAKQRREQYVEVNFSDNKVLVATYGIAAVGINITKLHNLVLIEPGKSFVRVIQSIGRGLRKGFDKDRVDIWDITSTCKFSRRHLTKRKQYYSEAEYSYALEKVTWE